VLHFVATTHLQRRISFERSTGFRLPCDLHVIVELRHVGTLHGYFLDRSHSLDVWSVFLVASDILSPPVLSVYWG